MVFAVEEQDPNEIEFFEFTLPGVYEQATKDGELEFDDDGKPVWSNRLEVHRLPKMQYLGVGMVEQIESEGIVGVMRIFGGNADAIRRLNGRQLGSLMAAWRSTSSVSLGESEA